MRFTYDQVGTLAFGLPNGLRGLNAVLLRFLAFCQNNAMPVLHAAADRHRLAPQLGMIPAFHRIEEIIQITM